MQWFCEKIWETDFLNVDLEHMRKLRLKAIKQAFEWHYTQCKPYRDYCIMHETQPSDIKSYEDIAKIQPIPSDAYRESDKLILSVPEESITNILTTSSTTSPKPVKFALDAPSFDRCARSQGALYNPGYDLADKNQLLYLSPSDKESETGLVRGSVPGWIAAGFKRENISFAVENKGFNYEKCIDKLKTFKSTNIYGPPFAHLSLVEYIEDNNIDIKLSEQARVITTGGWKGVAGQIPKEELVERQKNAFNIPDSQIRDGYGTSDLMCMIPECAHHHKHVPPWLNISIRDPKDLSTEVENGEKGMIVLMSSHIQSYVGFTMPGDLGIRWEDKCECGKTSQTMEILGRAKGLGSRGCALRLMEFMELISHN